VLGARVTVLSAVIDPVRVNTILLDSESVSLPSGIVIVCEVPVIAVEALPKASAISVKFVFVVVPQVPLPSPVAISLSLRLFIYELAIIVS
jgi:hypothetical protein